MSDYGSLVILILSRMTVKLAAELWEECERVVENVAVRPGSVDGGEGVFPSGKVHNSK